MQLYYSLLLTLVCNENKPLLRLYHNGQIRLLDTDIQGCVTDEGGFTRLPPERDTEERNEEFQRCCIDSDKIFVFLKVKISGHSDYFSKTGLIPEIISRRKHTTNASDRAKWYRRGIAKFYTEPEIEDVIIAEKPLGQATAELLRVPTNTAKQYWTCWVLLKGIDPNEKEWKNRSNEHFSRTESRRMLFMVARENSNEQNQALILNSINA
ncbi:hypothetical protein BKA66DRAFT_441175 [Pyrenochaeta sp. MPI-SDFR-AT-0127]|nr:hypothetical protein BKA66DRAFT_441175 [Pyrenochaeta sp. MPI-SDFR-AT-0127]